MSQSLSALALLILALVQLVVGALAPFGPAKLVGWMVAAATLTLALVVLMRPPPQGAANSLAVVCAGSCLLALILGNLIGPWSGMALMAIGWLVSSAWPEAPVAPKEISPAGLPAPDERRLGKLVSLLRELEKVGINLLGSTKSLSGTARHQETSIAQQASVASQILATSQEINSTSRQLLTTMNTVASDAAHTSKVANSGQELLLVMQQRMDQVLEAAQAISSKLSNLNERAHRIGRIATTISRVADQTNLLSLNAAIEAEKAGEAGRGFAVVAGEIQRLADQTALASLDIEQMIREMLTAVSSSVMAMEKFTEDVRHSAEVAHSVVGSLSQIIQQVQTMDIHFEQVNQGMHDQAQGAEQITDSIRQLSDATQRSAESISQFNAIVDSMKQATEQIAVAVVRGRSEEAKLGSGVHRAAPSTPPAPKVL